MDKLITWFDVETVIRRSMFAGLWPGGLVGVSVYPDEVEIRLKSENDRKEVEEALYQWFGQKYSEPEEKIYLEFTSNEEKRFLEVIFEVDPEGIQVIPGTLKPNFASFSLYPEAPRLKGPDFNQLAGPPFVWAFYSFKGGVSRTLHMISLVKALSEQEPPRRVLIVDADLEAPGLTWWAEEQLGKADISFLDFLGLVHYDTSTDYTDSLALTIQRLRHQILVFETRKTKVEHFFLPAFREIQQLMRMPIRPENVCWESGKEWIIPELLWKLGKALEAHAVVVDLRAGLSEISSPLLFDPRVNRVVITTPSGQSVEGTKRVLEQIRKISTALGKDIPDFESHFPTVILAMIKEDLKDIPDIGYIKEELIERIIPGAAESEELLDKQVLLESLFDENLLYLKNLKGTLEKLEGTDLHKLMSRIADEWIPAEIDAKKSFIDVDEKNYQEDLERLRDVAKDYEFAESGKATNFLVTQNLKTIARKFESSIPTAVIMGGKGAGKTYTYLQLAYLKQWSKFVEKVGGKKEADYGFIWPLLTSRNLGDDAKALVDKCRRYVVEMKKGIMDFVTLTMREVETQIDRQRDSAKDNLSGWREFWLQLMARSISCGSAPDPLAAMQKRLAENDTRIIFQIDGLEDRFQNIGKDPVEQAAVRALCQSVLEALQEWPGNRIGLLIFIRKDLVKSAIQQNFGQFEARYRGFELKWDREEALRLAAWLVHAAAGLRKYVRFHHAQMEIEKISGEAIENALEGLWGLKMGNPNSREAYTANWVISALSDFNRQLQARDLVRLIRYAADYALEPGSPRYKDRLLPPSAIKKALDPCSKEKIEEIQLEITVLKKIFEKLRKNRLEDRQIPFDRDKLGINATDIDIMNKLGIVTEFESKYYMPEIIRRGLGFSLISRGRLKVLTLLKQARNH